MDDLTKMFAEMGVNLTTMAVKGTASAVNTKIKVIRQNKDIEQIKNQYDEIINELLSEREEAIRIAMTYKTELERLEISDEDIEYLHNTISNALDLLNSFLAPDKKLPMVQIESIKGLISRDTLKAMQLLGFNYRKAIGEPLTNMCAQTIENKLSNKNKKK